MKTQYPTTDGRPHCMGCGVDLTVQHAPPSKPDPEGQYVIGCPQCGSWFDSRREYWKQFAQPEETRT
jgi:hypothetical protein